MDVHELHGSTVVDVREQLSDVDHPVRPFDSELNYKRLLRRLSEAAVGTNSVSGLITLVNDFEAKHPDFVRSIPDNIETGRE